MKTALALLIFAATAFAQNPPANPPTTTTDPTGKACSADQVLNYIPGGKLFSCQNGVYAAVAAAGAGTVTSVATACGATGGTITTTGTISESIATAAHNGSYAILTGDCGKSLTTNTAAAWTIAQAGTTGFEAAKFWIVNNIGSGSLTVTATTSTFYGGPSANISGSVLTVPTNTSATIVSDGTNYQVLSGGGSGSGSGGSVFTGSTAVTSAFSATPTFSLADVSVKSPIQFQPGAMTANVTSVTFTNKSAGAVFYIAWLQDGTGGRTVTYGGSASNTCSVSPTANVTTIQKFIVSADGTTVVGAGCTSTEAGISRGVEASAPATPASGSFVGWFDSTDHDSEYKNSSGSIFKGFLTGVDANPVTGQVTNGSHITNSSIPNSGLVNTSITFNTAGPITGGGTVPLGGTVTYGCTTCVTAARDVKVIPFAAAPAGTAGSGVSYATGQWTPTARAGSNNIGAALQAIPSTGAALQFRMELPADWITSSQPYIRIEYASASNTSGTVIWTVSSACTKADGSVTDDPAFNAESAFASQTMAAANRAWSQTGQFTAVTSGNNCVPGGGIIFKIALSGTASAAINAYQAVVTVPVTPVVQAE